MLLNVMTRTHATRTTLIMAVMTIVAGCARMAGKCAGAGCPKRRPNQTHVDRYNK
jgi:hypothetical protein